MSAGPRRITAPPAPPVGQRGPGCGVCFSCLYTDSFQSSLSPPPVSKPGHQGERSPPPLSLLANPLLPPSFRDRHLQGLPRFRGGGRSRGIAADLPNGEEGKRKTQWRRERWEKNMKRGQEREETVACGRGWWRTGLLTVEIPGRGGVGPGAPQGRGWHRR